MLEKELIAQVIADNTKGKEEIRAQVLSAVETNGIKSVISIRKLVVLGIFLTCLISLSTYYFTSANIKFVDTDRLILANDFEQLVSVSDLIIRAKVMPDKQNILLSRDDGSMYFGYTLTSLQVKEVFSGEVNSSDLVLITEEYYKVGRDVFTQGNYLPAEKNGEYIFFLKRYEDSTTYKDMYYPVDLEKGKYSLDSKILGNLDDLDTMSNKQLSIGPKESGDYRELYNKVIEKYMR